MKQEQIRLKLQQAYEDKQARQSIPTSLEIFNSLFVSSNEFS